MSKYPAAWETETVNMHREPETVNRKGLQVTKSLEASQALKKLEVGGLKGHAKLQECIII
jgi:hypothetical protein